VNIRWTDSDIALLREHYRKGLRGHPPELLAKFSRASIFNKAYKIGLTNLHRKSVKTRIKDQLALVSAVDLAYIAGIFDGEGWISTSGKGRFRKYWIIGIGSTCLPVLEFIKKRVPTSSIKVRKHVANRRQGYELAIAGQLCIYDFLGAVLPFLIIRREKAREAMSAIRSNWPHICDS
jgi:hypothetical protein